MNYVSRLLACVFALSMSITVGGQNYCPDTTIVIGSPVVGEEQSSTISTSQWDQNAHNLSAICRGEVTPRSTTLPATCTVGQIFFDTDAATAGNNLFGCTSTDTWTLLGDGGGGGGSPNSFSTVDTSSGTDPVADSSTDTLTLSGTSPIIITGDSSLDSVTLSVTQNAGTDITSDLEEETHAPEHNQGGSDSISGESLASLCSSGNPLEGDGAGGLQCGIDDTGTDDQSASEVNISDTGAFFTGATVEDALQEVGPTMTDSRTPTAHSSSHNENGSDEVLGENLGTACTDGQILVANTTGGMVCGNPGSASFTTLDGDYGDETILSTHDISGGTLQLPNSDTLPSTSCDNDTEKGRIYIDNDAESGQQIYICEGSSLGWVLSSGGSSPSLLHVRHELASGTNGGDASASTWNTRPINTTKTNTIAGASLLSNQITLPAGDYRIKAWSIACLAGFHKLRLRDITSSTTLVVGRSNFSGSAICTDANLVGAFTLISESDLEIQHWIQTISSAGGDMGSAVSSGESEVYLDVWIEQE